VLARLDQTYQAFFRRVQRGEKAGFPRFTGRTRFHSFKFKEVGNGARFDNGSLVLSKIGRIAVHWSRPIPGTIKTVTLSKAADGWPVSFSCAEVPREPLPRTGKETGRAVGLKVFLVTADGAVLDNPRHSRKAERALKQAQRRVSRRKKGSNRRRKAVQLLARKQQEAATGAPSAARLPPQGCARPRACRRPPLRRGDPACHLESPSRPRS
jgi:putative transposase